MGDYQSPRSEPEIEDISEEDAPSGSEDEKPKAAKRGGLDETDDEEAADDAIYGEEM